MNEWIDQIKAWWLPLSVKEKQSVAVGGICLIVFLLYVVIWSPLSNSVGGMRKQIVNSQKTLQFMRAAEKQIAENQGNDNAPAAVSSVVDFLSYLQKQLNTAGLSSSVTSLKQSADDAVTLKCQQVEFDRLVRLLLVVMKEQRVSVEQMTAVAGSTPGMAGVDLVLKLSN